MKVKITTLLIGFLALISSGLSVQAQNTSYPDEWKPTPIVTSDKGEYAPGEIAVITGTGWTLDSLVDVHFEEDPVHDHQHDYHDTKVDSNGNWRIDFPIEERHIGVQFTVIAEGKATAHTSFAYFTDANRYAVKSGNWDGNIWAEFSDGFPQPLLLPVSEDVVTILGGRNVTVTDSRTIHTVTIGGVSLSTAALSLQSGGVLTVASKLSIGISITRKGSLDMTNGGTLRIGNTFTAPALMSFLPGTGTVEYYKSGDQSVLNFGDGYNNLTLSGLGLKSVIGVNVNGILSFEGSTASNGAVSYGPSASLQYNRTSSGTTTLEWPANFTTTGGVIIKNIGAVTLGGNKNMPNGSLVLAGGTIKTGITGFNLTAKALVLSNNSTISLGTGSHSLTFGNSSQVEWAVGKTLTINGWAGRAGETGTAGRIFVGPSGLSPEQLGSINFSGYPPGASIINGEVVPGSKPIISSSLNATTTYGSGFSYQIVASNNPENYSTSALPPGITFDTISGGLTIAPTTAAGVYDISIFATNSAGTDSAVLTLNVEPKLISVSANAGQSKVYGDPDPKFGFTSSETLLSGNIFTGALGREAGEEINGPYQFTLNNLSAGNNYSITLAGNYTFAIVPRLLKITADPQNKTYGDSDPELTYKIVEGTLAYNDNFSGSLSRAAGENSGVYTINQGDIDLNDNYDLTFNSAEFTIVPRNISITADSQAKTYGDSDPEFTAQADGVIEGDVATGFLSRQAGENAGTYAILKGSYTFGPNYKETYSNSDLVISPRNITIMANAMDKYCGQPDPILTYSVTNGNLVNEDTVSGSLGREVGENIGDFEITKGTLALNSNYSLSYTGALFNIKINSIDGSASSNPVKLNDTVELSATVKDVTSLINNVSVTFIVTNGMGISVGEHTAVTNINGIATAKVYGLPLGLYQIKAIVGNGCSESIAYLPVYDPNSSFITGGGWINSPPGALVGTTVTGKANFGFVAKYKKGNNAVDGNTEFQFQAGSFNFKSTFLNAGTLIISGGKATYKGEGTVNGSGNYEFVVSAFDGEVNGKDNIDKFRIKIWIKGSPSNVIYDNLLGFADNADLPEATTLGGGSVVIHEVKGGKQATSTPTVDAGRGLDMKIIEPVQLQKSKLTVYPNPFAKNATIAFTFPTNEQMVSLDIYDLKGSRITRIFEGKAEANQTLKFDFNGLNLSPGLYLLRLTSPTGVANFKMIMTE